MHNRNHLFAIRAAVRDLVSQFKLFFCRSYFMLCYTCMACYGMYVCMYVYCINSFWCYNYLKLIDSIHWLRSVNCRCCSVVVLSISLSNTYAVRSYQSYSLTFFFPIQVFWCVLFLLLLNYDVILAYIIRFFLSFLCLKFQHYKTLHSMEAIKTTLIY